MNDVKTRIFSVVSAVYNVDRYLNDFLSSLERQSYGLQNLDIILVDDGSTDESLVTLRAFEAKHPGSVRVFSKENGGQSSARNFGIDKIRGDWVTFPDPDDTLSKDFFANIDRFLHDQDSTELQVVSVGTTMHFEERGEFSDTHPLRNMFRYGDRSINLIVEPDCIQMSATRAVFDVRSIEQHEMRFDERIRPNFEDGHFVAAFLLRTGSTRIGAVQSARYNYRKRADGSSTLMTAGANLGRYLSVPRHGFLALLQEATDKFGTVPEWLQNVVLYELAWYLRSDSNLRSNTGGIPSDVLEVFNESLVEIRRYLSTDQIQAFRIMAMSDDHRFALLHGYSSEPHVPHAVRTGDIDAEQGLVQLRYRFAGDLPDEMFYVDGEPSEPAHSKTRALTYYGRTVARERIVWIPNGSRIRVSLNGRFVPFKNDVEVRTSLLEKYISDGKLMHKINQRPEQLRHATESLTSRLMKRARAFRRYVAPTAAKSRIYFAALSTALHSPLIRKRFRNAWVFMDRNTDAGDSAEYLYRYITSNHPEINTWFVINRGVPDWHRLRKEDVRVVAYGSWQWQLLMLSAAHVASSHADQYVMQPLDAQRFGPPRWRFTFLQHGVIKDDLSRWLNPKRLDLFVTASPAEFESIVSDGSPYSFTTKEVKLTGLPRHDALRAKRDAVAEGDRDLLLVMPTWRSDLVGDSAATSTDRSVKSGFAHSDYARNYSDLLNSASLEDVAKRHDLRVVFMPHPNMRPYLAEFDLPSHVQVVTYDDADVQQMLARGKLLITDYSSMAFNAAALDMPTVYFQFDQEAFYSGSHTGRKGYYDYELHGFGPVCTTLSDVEAAVDDLVTGRGATDEYARRMQATFAHHDTNNSRRVFEAMRSLDSPT